MGEPSSRNEIQFPRHSSYYEIFDKIGSGDSFIVYKARYPSKPKHPDNYVVVAIKSIDIHHQQVSSDETTSALNLSHPNILTPHCSFNVNDIHLCVVHRWVVMPYMSAGSLHSVITSKFSNGIDEPYIAVILNDILNGLSYLHHHGHLFRDGDILMDSNGSVKLAPNFDVTSATSSYWVAPELVDAHNGYGSKAADIWSVGIIALELAHGGPPLSALPASKSLRLKIKKRVNLANKNMEQSDSFKEMVSCCLDQDPARRPSVDQLLEHSFFKKYEGAENRLGELPRVEDMFKALGDVSSKNVEDEGESSSVVGRRSGGWSFVPTKSVVGEESNDAGGAVNRDMMLEDLRYYAWASKLLRKKVEDMIRERENHIEFLMRGAF